MSTHTSHPPSRPISLSDKGLRCKADMLVELGWLIPVPWGDRNEQRGKQSPDDTCAALDQPRKQSLDCSVPQPPRPQRTTAPASTALRQGTCDKALRALTAAPGQAAAELRVTVIILLSLHLKLGKPLCCLDFSTIRLGLGINKMTG